jgi:ParB-like chromosome segregation protein Spo0J
MPALHVHARPIAGLKPNPRNARTHSNKQIRQIADSIRVFGFTNPVLIDPREPSSPGMAGSPRRDFSAGRRCPPSSSPL